MRIPHRWLPLVPGALAALLTLLFASYLLWSRHEALTQQQQHLEQDLLWQKQALEHQLGANRDAALGLAATLSGSSTASPVFQARVLSLLQTSPEVASIAVYNRAGEQTWRSIPGTDPTPGAVTGWGELYMALGVPQVQYLTYTPDHQQFIVLVISLDRLLQQQVPWWIAQRYQITLLTEDGTPLASKFQRRLDTTGAAQTIDLTTPPLGLQLKAEYYDAPVSLIAQLTPWLLVVLAAIILASTAALVRMMRVRSQAESRLRSETALRQAMEESLVTGLRAMDLQGRMLYANRAFCDMVGFSIEELQGQGAPLPYWPSEDYARCRALFDAMLSGKLDANGFTARFMRKNGERFDVRVYASRLIDGDGRHIGWMSSMYDITELQREREALQASHERFVTVLNGLDAAVAVSDDQNGELLMSNQRFDEAFELPVQRGRCCVVPFAPRAAGRQSDTQWFDVYRQHWYQIKSRPSVWVDGSAVWLEIATDITALKDAAERERMQTEALAQTTRLISMGEMASSLAHELNQPLGAIASYASGCRNIMATEPPNMRQLELAIDKINEQAKRAGQIIRGIREFVQRRAPQRTPCAPQALLDTVLELLRPEIRKRGLTPTLTIASALPQLYADPVMLEQVLFNLVKNALEAMDETPRDQRQLGIALTVEGNLVRFAVSDRGTGLTDELLEQLFQAFFTTKPQGMGMGLNICRTIIEHHHGRLWAEVNPGGGSRFIFTVPYTEERDAHEP
ncbi:PAS domain-containing sensor histidine kinase [Chitinibacteraceae bacterium HSL-7]